MLQAYLCWAYISPHTIKETRHCTTNLKWQAYDAASLLMLGIHFSPYHQGDKTLYNKLEMVGLWCCKPTHAGHTFLPIPSRRQDIVQQTWNGRPMMLQAYSCWAYISPHTIKVTRYFMTNLKWQAYDAASLLMLDIHFSPYHQGDKTFYNKLEMVGLWRCKPTYAGNAIFPIPSRWPDILWQTWNGRPMMLQAYSCWTYISPHTIKETRHFTTNLKWQAYDAASLLMLGIHFSPYHQGDQIFYDKLEMVGLWCCKPTHAGYTFLPIPSRRQDIVQQTWNGKPMMLQAYSCWAYISPHTIKVTRYFMTNLKWQAYDAASLLMLDIHFSPYHQGDKTFYNKLEMVGLWCCKPTHAGHTFLPIPSRWPDILWQTWNGRPMMLQAYSCWTYISPHTIKVTRHFTTNLKW